MPSCILNLRQEESPSWISVFAGYSLEEHLKSNSSKEASRSIVRVGLSYFDHTASATSQRQARQLLQKVSAEAPFLLRNVACVPLQLGPARLSRRPSQLRACRGGLWQQLAEYLEDGLWQDLYSAAVGVAGRLEVGSSQYA